MERVARGKNKEWHRHGEGSDDPQLLEIYADGKTATDAIHKASYGRQTKKRDIFKNSAKIGLKLEYFCNMANNKG